MEGVVRPETIWVMRAIKARYLDVEVGTMVDPHVAAQEAMLNPEGPGYNRALRELLDAQALRSPPGWDGLPAPAVGANPLYQVTAKGKRMIAGA